MNRSNVQAFLAAAALSAGMIAGTTFLAPSAWADDTGIALQGKGPKREALDAMQYKAFDTGVFDHLKAWSGGPALASAGMKGKPVLIVGWSSWLKSSQASLPIVQQAVEKYGAMGLEVVAVHHTRGFDAAKKIIDDAKFTGRYAHDEKGEFFKAMKIEGGGPDYYLVDRAGNLRFAQIDRKSVEAAIEKLVKETPEEAAKATAPAPSSGPESGGGGGGGSWKQPPASEYASAKWPDVNKALEHAKNVQGKQLPVRLGKETWITEKPALEGKVLVLDFWATWCGPCIAVSPALDQLQTKHKGELVIIGMSGQKRPGKPEDVSAIKSFLEKKPAKYSHANDTSQGVYKSLDIQAIPHVVVISSDGIVRWQGNPHDQAFTKAVETCVKNDPGVKAGAKK